MSAHTLSKIQAEVKCMSELKMLCVYFCGTGSNRGAPVLIVAVRLLS